MSCNSLRDITPMNVSLGTTLHNKTGAWRFLKPVYEDKVPVCQDACPAGNDIEGWLNLLGRNEFEEAYHYLKQEEPFPAILGRVCFKFCEDACNRKVLDQCVEIGELERFIGDQFTPSAPHRQIPQENGKLLAVVGSGPAGMSAAYFARLLGFDVTVFEKLPTFGGMLQVGIPSYRLPKAIVEAEFEGLARMGIKLRADTEIGKGIPLEKITSSFDYVFLGTGACKSNGLGLKGKEQGPQVLQGLDMLKKVALGEAVSLGRRVLVIGGGNTAIDVSRTAVRLGCEVTVIYRRSEAEMPAGPEEVQAARQEGVVFKFLMSPENIVLGDDGRMEHLVCCKTALGSLDESGRREPVRKEGDTINIKADAILTATGEKPDFEYLGPLIDPPDTAIKVDPGLRIRSAENMKARIYAGGDIIDNPRTVIHAMASGKRAAIAMDCDRKGRNFVDVLSSITVGHRSTLSFSRYMGWPAVNPVRRNNQIVVDPTMIVYDYFKKTPAVGKKIQNGNIRKDTFEPYQETFTVEEARNETKRCIHCGRCTECDNCLVFCPELSVLNGNKNFGYAFDYDYCKGCGICAMECPRSAITMINNSEQAEGQEKREA